MIPETHESSNKSSLSNPNQINESDPGLKLVSTDDLRPKTWAAKGYALVKLRKGKKSATTQGWPTKAAAPTTIKYGFGVNHGLSGTCSVDYDNLEASRVWFAERGIDIAVLMQETFTYQGNPDRRKSLYRLPADVELSYAKHSFEGGVAFELRCGAQYDVLPPSQVGENVYKCLTSPRSVADLPEPPPALLQVWRELGGEKSRTSSAPPRAKPPCGTEFDVIFEKHNYECTAPGRWRRPGSKEDGGVFLMDDREHIISYHAGCPLNDGRPHTAVEVSEMLKGQKDGYIRNKAGRIIGSEIQNIDLMLEEYGIEVKFNEFSDRAWVKTGTGKVWKELDLDLAPALCVAVRREFRPVRLTADDFKNTLTNLSYVNKFHPVKDYFKTLEWDGVPRLDTWISDYTEAEETPLTSELGKLWWIAAVRRVMQPGSKFDQLLVLEGPQGSGKGRLIRAICPKPEWYTDSLYFKDKAREIQEKTAGILIVEIAEMIGLRGVSAQWFKHMLSTEEETARAAYGRNRKTIPRAFIMIGTTNDSTYLNDVTGNRRIWPIWVGKCDWAKMAKDRDQLWAEAVFREAKGESTELDERWWQEAKEVQESRRELKQYEELLGRKLGEMEGWISTESVRAIVGEARDMRPESLNRNDRVEISDSLRALGYIEHTAKVLQKSTRGWVSPEHWGKPDKVRYEFVKIGHEYVVWPSDKVVGARAAIRKKVKEGTTSVMELCSMEVDD